MHVLRALGIEKAYGDRLILKGCDLEVATKDRVGLVGPNGSGKSTLLRILGDIEGADHGEITLQGRMALLHQDPRLPGRTVGEAADEALSWHRDLLDRWQQALDDDRIDDAARLQSELDLVGWERAHEVDGMLDRLGAPPREAPLDRLSGGERRRVALARALLQRPELLILDEPTNHLDAETIEWLQSWLQGYPGAVLLVTHDRYLLEAVADRIVEIDDGKTVSYAGSYADYLISRAERQANLARAEDRRLSLIAREAEWASRSPAARTTKQKGRLQRLEALKALPALKQQKAMSLDLSTGLKTGRSVLELHGLRKAYGDRVLFDDLSFNLMAGDRLGILGPNGAGKSTLLRILAQAESADRGTVHKAPRFKVAVLDQHRTGLDDADTVHEAAGGGNDHVIVGDRSVHVAGFLSRFLFRREMLDQRVETLSGGERARLLLAKLLLRGCNLLLLDEPTNDLDLQTLRVLEEALLSFDGACVVITHDRAFLDRVCTRLLAFHGDSTVATYADRLQVRREMERRAEAARQAASARRARDKATAATAPTDRLTYAEKKELAALPVRIEEAEAALEEVEAQLADPTLWSDRPEQAPPLSARAQALPDEIAALYERWERLAARAE